jgi:hypothetical protein
MVREVYGKNGDPVVVMDVRDLLHGQYSVDKLVYGGYKSVFSSRNLEKCIAKAKEIESRFTLADGRGLK